MHNMASVYTACTFSFIYSNFLPILYYLTIFKGHSPDWESVWPVLTTALQKQLQIKSVQSPLLSTYFWSYLQSFIRPNKMRDGTSLSFGWYFNPTWLVCLAAWSQNAKFWLHSLSHNFTFSGFLMTCGEKRGNDRAGRGRLELTSSLVRSTSLGSFTFTLCVTASIS